MHAGRHTLLVLAALALGSVLSGCVTEEASTGPLNNQDDLNLPFGPLGSMEAPAAWQNAMDANPAGPSAPFSPARNVGYFPNSQ